MAARVLKAVAVEKYNHQGRRHDASIAEMQRGGAQVVITYGHRTSELGQIANGMQKLGWKVPMIGSWTLSMPTSSTPAEPMPKVR